MPDIPNPNLYGNLSLACVRVTSCDAGLVWRAWETRSLRKWRRKLPREIGHMFYAWIDNRKNIFQSRKRAAKNIFTSSTCTYNHIHFNRILFAWVIATGFLFISAKIGRKAETECPVAAHCNKIIRNLQTCISHKQTTPNNVCSVSRQSDKPTHVPAVYL